MNYSTAVFLVNKNARAIVVSYEPNKSGALSNEDTLKTLDQSVKVGDLVVVETDTRYKMTVGKVTEVDVPVDFDSTKQMRWIVSKVDHDAYDALLAQEQQAIDTIRKAMERKRRDDLASALMKDHADTLKALPLTTAGDVPAIAAK